MSLATSELNSTIAVAQMRTVPGNVRQNLAQMLNYIADARRRGANLVAFPELATSGYLLGDRWEHDAFVREIEEANETIREASDGITVIWGSLKADRKSIGEDGRVRKYNAAFIAQDGAWVSNGILDGWIPKTNLPKYRIFDDARHFYPATKLAEEMKISLRALLCPFAVIINGGTVRLALTVCEDLWEDEYNAKPSRIYRDQDVGLVIDISQSPWTLGKRRARNSMLRKRSEDSQAPILYVNSIGLQNNTKNLVWFDGGSAMMGDDGFFSWQAPEHREGLFMCQRGALATQALVAEQEEIGEIFEAIIPAMREFFAPFPTVVIGLSGGIDSAVMAALLVEALGPKKVLAVNMPSEYNSRTTRCLAEACARTLGIEYRVVPIQALYEKQLDILRGAGYADPSMLVRENIQARIRCQELASIAACDGGVFTNNGNKTEVALNYFTLYGDGAGAAAFLGDLWKGQIYALARFLNARKGRDAIPQGILDIVPSAELSPDQNVDEGKGDPIFYEYHDQLLRMFIEKRWDPTIVLEHAINGTLEEDLGIPQGTMQKYFKTSAEMVANLEWAWRQYNVEFKRVQLPPVFLTSRRAFGFDRRDTIADAYFSDEYYRLRSLYCAPAS